MHKPSVVALSVLYLLLISSLLVQAQAQAPKRMTVEASSTAATTTCQATYSSGTFHWATEFCVTVNGNIPLFYLDNQPLFNTTPSLDLEGYGICDVTASKSYYDWAAVDSGGWNASKFVQSGNTITVTRTTSDGNWQLTQTIVNVPATATATGSANVTMKLKNLTTTNRSVNLMRFANVDAANLPSTNDFNASEITSLGQFPFGVGLMLTNHTGNNGSAFVLNVGAGPDPCAPYATYQPTLPFVGDGSLILLWTKTINHGATFTASSSYRGY
jgi:hypothetical protein